jgi:uncharacterized OsmC-like protein
LASRPHNVLGDETRPRFFPVDVTAAHPLRPPENRRGTAVRVWARSLAGMQKEVLVATTLGDEVWRLASDEGGDLNGYDEAPFPLGHMAAGMLASYTTEVRAVAHRRGVELRDLRLTLDNYYTMEGSALRSTMLGGALAPELTVECHTDAAADVLRGLVSDAVHASPVDALLRAALTSVFTLTVNGRPCGTGAMPECADGCAADPRDLFTDVEVASSPVHQPLVQLLPEADPVDDVGDGGGLTETQNRLLHVRGACTVREDGVKEIVVQLRKPAGAAFRFLSDEPQGDGSGRAPDAASYLAAGIAFCFMTQFGRYAAIARKSLENYRLVQDLHLPQGGASGGPGTVGSADPVETHVFLETEHGEEFGQQALAMSEQTCFLHAMCRSALETRIRVLSPT